MCSGALKWEGVHLSCSLMCSRMYCWQKQRGRSRVSPEHSQLHERMMVDYLHEMSYTTSPKSQESTLTRQSSRAEDRPRNTEGENPSPSCLLAQMSFPKINPKNVTDTPHPTPRSINDLIFIIFLNLCDYFEAFPSK